MSTLIALRIDPPLPCAVLAADSPDRRCGRPASVAQAEQLPDGAYRLFPICRDCVVRMAATYGVTDDPPPAEARAARPPLSQIVAESRATLQRLQRCHARAECRGPGPVRP